MTPTNHDALVLLAHGGGGRLSRALLQEEILSRFSGPSLAALPDAATLENPGGDLVFTTDSFVVRPVEFPGGNIGHLAVHGTVNDLAVCGARPRWLSLALILEEGFPRTALARVLDALRDAAAACDVSVCTGDTKVVGRGEADGIFINTAGIGTRLPGFTLSAASLQDGDAVLVSGPVGDHGMAVMAARAGMGAAGGPRSDSGPVHRLTAALQPMAASVRFMRDPTRGGLAAVLNEMVDGAPVGIRIDEASLPVAPSTRAVAEMLGIDPLNAACEGRVVAVCADAVADCALEAWRALPEGAGAARIGSVTGPDAGRVVLQTLAGGSRLVDVPLGELLPRIC
jgi:hydrogenase expression/formation protein HypE